MVDLLLALAVAVTSWLLVHGIRYWTRRHGILDVPNRRSSHTRPTPRGGGVAIAVICIAGFAAYWLWRPDYPGRVVVAYCMGATLIAVVSWIDDVRGCSRLARFATHAVAAVLLVLLLRGNSTAVTVPWAGDVSLGWLAMPIAFVWLVGLTNAYNFMDGIDGIAGAQAVVAGLGWVILGKAVGQPTLSALGLLVAASSLGFLVHNRPPARIFMGDVGSAFLGYTFAFLAVAATQADPRLGIAGVLLVWPFVFDTAVTFLRRLCHGENVFAAHRSHLYQRLVIAGWTHGAVTSLYAGLALFGLVLAFAFTVEPGPGDWLAAVLLPLAALALWLFVSRVESRHAGGVATDPTGEKPPCEEHPRGQRAKPSQGNETRP